MKTSVASHNPQVQAAVQVKSCNAHYGSSCKPPLYRDNHNTEMVMGSIGEGIQNRTFGKVEYSLLKNEVEILRTEVDHLYELIAQLKGWIK